MTDSTFAGPTNDRVLIFTATYNEYKNIGTFCDLVLNQPTMADLLVVDDNSPDGTGEVLDELAAKEPRLTVIHRPRKLGLGSAHMLAFAYAEKRGYDTLITMDADLSHDPNSIPDLVAALGDADFVIGSRYMKGGTCEYSGYRRIVSQCANFLSRWLLGIRLHEFTTSFRAFRVSKLRELNYSQIGQRGYSFFLESLWFIHCGGWRIREVPISFTDRMHGESKIPRNEILNGLLKLLQLFLQRLRLQRQSGLVHNTVHERCYACGSDLMVERYPRLGTPVRSSQVYQCTSMAHQSKPQVVQCLACGLLAAEESNRHLDLTSLYADVVDADYVRYQHAKERTAQITYKAIAPYLPSTGTMLEVGAYCGFFLKAAREKGWAVEGVEPSKWAVTYARQQHGLDVRQGTIKDAGNSLARDYDSVVMWDVLEHLADPMDAMRDIHGLLKDDGVFCLSTLDVEGWFPKVTGKRWPWIMDMHLFYFDAPGLIDMLRRQGFETIAVVPYRHYASAEYFLRKVASNLPGPLGLLASPLIALVPHRLVVPLYFGDTKLFICRKIATRSE